MRRSSLIISALLSALLAVSVPAVGAGAQEVPPCAGITLSGTVASPQIPGGSWSVDGTCVEPGTAFESSVLGYQLVVGIGADTYTDGHGGRIAFANVRLSETESATLVGVEDIETQQITWAFSDAPRVSGEGVRSVSGPANTATVTPETDLTQPVPVEPGSLELSMAGVGSDLETAEGPAADALRRLLDLAVDALGESSEPAG